MYSFSCKFIAQSTALELVSGKKLLKYDHLLVGAKSIDEMFIVFLNYYYI